MKLQNLLISATVTTLAVSASATTISGDTELTVDSSIAYLKAYDNSSVVLNPGSSISFLDNYDESSTKASGADISFYHGYNNSSLTTDNSDISWIHLFDNSTGSIENMTDISWLTLDGNAYADIYGSSFSYNNGHLSGIWGNGESFSFWALNYSDWSLGNVSNILPENLILHTIAVPEPATLTLLSIGLFGLATSRRKSKANIFTV